MSESSRVRHPKRLRGEELDRINKGWEFYLWAERDGWLWRRRIVRVTTLKYRARKRRR